MAFGGGVCCDRLMDTDAARLGTLGTAESAHTSSHKSAGFPRIEVITRDERRRDGRPSRSKRSQRRVWHLGCHRRAWRGSMASAVGNSICGGRHCWQRSLPRSHFDRVEWRTISDIGTVVAALTRGEVDWIDSVPADLLPQLARNRDVTVEVIEPTGSIQLLRFNCLHPPFDNAAMRRALLGAIDQSEVMRAVAGSDPSTWRDRVGLFSPRSRMANDAGIEALSGPRDRDRVRRGLTAAGYDGRPVVVLAIFQPYFREAADVVADQLRKAGMNLDVQTMDFPTMLRRRDSKEPPEKGGWNAFVSLTDGLFIDKVTNYAFRGDGTPASAWLASPGWRPSARPGWRRRTWPLRRDSLRRCSANFGWTCPIFHSAHGFAPRPIGGTLSICLGDMPRFAVSGGFDFAPVLIAPVNPVAPRGSALGRKRL